MLCCGSSDYILLFIKTSGELLRSVDIHYYIIAFDESRRIDSGLHIAGIHRIGGCLFTIETINLNRGIAAGGRMYEDGFAGNRVGVKCEPERAACRKQYAAAVSKAAIGIDHFKAILIAASTNFAIGDAVCV